MQFPRASVTLAIKYLSIPFFVAIPLTANAIDLTPDASRVISDPLFLPLKGQVYGNTNSQYTDTTSDVYSSNGNKTLSRTIKSSTINQEVGYGITDDFSVRVSDAYSPSDKTENSLVSGTTTSRSRSGLNDPTFGATWRVLDQRQFPITWDIIASYSPDWVESKAATATQEGTEARGGQLAEAQTGFGYKTKDFTIAGGVGAIYHGKRDVYDPSNSGIFRTDAWWGYAAQINTQTRFTDRISLNLGATETLNSSADGVTSAGLATTSKPGDVTNLHTRLNFTLVPNKLVANLSYQYVITTDSKFQYPNNASFDTINKNQNSNIFGGGLEYTF